MADFLARMADRALGLGPRVQPLVGSRFIDPRDRGPLELEVSEETTARPAMTRTAAPPPALEKAPDPPETDPESGAESEPPVASRPHAPAARPGPARAVPSPSAKEEREDDEPPADVWRPQPAPPTEVRTETRAPALVNARRTERESEELDEATRMQTARKQVAAVEAAPIAALSGDRRSSPSSPPAADRRAEPAPNAPTRRDRQAPTAPTPSLPSVPARTDANRREPSSPDVRGPDAAPDPIAQGPPDPMAQGPTRAKHVPDTGTRALAPPRHPTRRRAPDEPAGTVRVEIGRVEVRAPVPPPPEPLPQAPAARVAPRLSLNEYLRTRGLRA